MARKSMNIVDVASWLMRAKTELEGRTIGNIYYEKEAGLIYIKVKGAGIIIAEPGRRIHRTSRRAPPQEFKPDPLVVLARKYMKNKRIKTISLVNDDRIVKITTSNDYSLVVELVPRGIAAVLDPSNTILAASKYMRLRDRVVRPKEAYRPPPKRGEKLESITPDDVIEAYKAKGKLVPALVSVLGVPGEVAEEAVHRAGASGEELGPGEAERIVEAIREILEESMKGHGYLVSAPESPIEADPFNPTHYAGEYEITRYEAFDDALDDFFEASPVTAKGKRATDSLEGERAKLLASIEKAKEQAREYRERAEKLRRIADVITKHYPEFQSLLECVRKGRGDCRVEGVAEARSGGKNIIVVIEGITLTIPRSVASVDQLIVEVFKKAGQLEAKAERARSLMIDVEKKLAEIELKARARSLAEAYKRRKRYWFEAFHYTVTRSGFLVIGGRDAGQNEVIARKYLEPGDIFMHADIHGAPAVVVKTRGRVPGEDDLYDAAVIAVAYSKAWKTGVGAVRVFYVDASQVSLSPPTGEYLAKGGIMVYGRKNYLKPIPVRLWLGVALDDEGLPRLLPGSEEAVRVYSIAYASILPGDEKKLVVAEELRKKLSSVLDDEKKHFPLAIPVEDYSMRLPGRARISRVNRGAGKGLSLTLLRV
ncbi:MAG: NFACT family protein [Desulfurococcales archaeon]|nr:NFACT family protein [Desulfurococcales archaeon]